MNSHRLLNGTKIPLGDLSSRERDFLRTLTRMVAERVSYFEVYRLALGPGSPALQGRIRVDRDLVKTPVYLVARDIATRVGIRQGLILAPEHESERRDAERIEAPISVAQAADLIGISRVAAYKAVQEGRLASEKIGNVFVVRRADAKAYKRTREAGRRSDTGRRPATATAR